MKKATKSIKIGSGCIISLLLICIWISTMIFMNGLLKGPLFVPQLENKSDSKHPALIALSTTQNAEKLKLIHEDFMAKGPHVKKTIFMLIDALRYDMAVHINNSAPWGGQFHVFEKYCRQHPTQSYLHKLIADPPNITAIKIKIMMTGSFGSYAGMLENFMSKDFAGDSIVNQVKSEKMGAIFIGEILWKFLFGPHFERTYDVETKAIADLTTGVDFAKSIVFKELRKQDWKFMANHLSPIDHAAHYEGMESQAMKDMINAASNYAKDVIGNLTEEYEDSLIIITGDHGLTNKGGHGGTTTPEEQETVTFVHHTHRPLTYSFWNLCLNASRHLEFAWGETQNIPSDFTFGQMEKCEELGNRLDLLKAIHRKLSEIVEFNPEEMELFSPYTTEENRSISLPLGPEVRQIPQVSISSTIATITGVPIPFINVGTLIPAFLPFQSNQSICEVFYYTSVAYLENLAQFTRYLQAYESEHPGDVPFLSLALNIYHIHEQRLLRLSQLLPSVIQIEELLVGDGHQDIPFEGGDSPFGLWMQYIVDNSQGSRHLVNNMTTMMLTLKENFGSYDYTGMVIGSFLLTTTFILIFFIYFSFAYAPNSFSVISNYRLPCRSIMGVIAYIILLLILSVTAGYLIAGELYLFPLTIGTMGVIIWGIKYDLVNMWKRARTAVVNGPSSRAVAGGTVIVVVGLVGRYSTMTSSCKSEIEEECLQFVIVSLHLLMFPYYYNMQGRSIKLETVKSWFLILSAIIFTLIAPYGDNIRYSRLDDPPFHIKLFSSYFPLALLSALIFYFIYKQLQRGTSTQGGIQQRWNYALSVSCIVSLGCLWNYNIYHLSEKELPKHWVDIIVNLYSPRVIYFVSLASLSLLTLGVIYPKLIFLSTADLKSKLIGLFGYLSIFWFLSLILVSGIDDNPFAFCLLTAHLCIMAYLKRNTDNHLASAVQEGCIVMYYFYCSGHRPDINLLHFKSLFVGFKTYSVLVQPAIFIFSFYGTTVYSALILPLFHAIFYQKGASRGEVLHSAPMDNGNKKEGEGIYRYIVSWGVGWILMMSWAALPQFHHAYLSRFRFISLNHILPRLGFYLPIMAIPAIVLAYLIFSMITLTNSNPNKEEDKEETDKIEYQELRPVYS